MFYLSKLLLIGLFGVNMAVFASGGGEEKKEEGKEEGKAEGAADVPIDKFFSQTQLKVQNLSVRQEDYRKQIDELTEKRRTAKSRAEQKALRQQMVEIEKTQKKELKELEELKTQLKYRYPDFGEIRQRDYATEQRKPAMEPNTDGLKDVLSATKRAMEEQYRKPVEKKSYQLDEVVPKSIKDDDTLDE